MASNGMRSFERNHFFYGKLMTARDFKAEQEYHREKQWLHTRLAHDFGVVGGLRVRPDPESTNAWRMILEPGIAVDGQGREIVVTQPHPFDLSKLILDSGLSLSDLQRPLYLTLTYQEAEAEPVPVFARDSASAETAAPNRIREGYSLGVSSQIPDQGVGLAQKLSDILNTALNPVDLGKAYKHLGGLGITRGVSRLTVGATADDVLAASQTGKLLWVQADGLTRTDVGAMIGVPVAIAAGPGVAWIAAPEEIRLAVWPPNNPPALTRAWADKEISAIVAQPKVAEDQPTLRKAYYLSVVEDVTAPEARYWRIAEITNEGGMVELSRRMSPAKCLAISPDGATLYFVQQIDEAWRVCTLDLGTNSVQELDWTLPAEPAALQIDQMEQSLVFLAVTAAGCLVRYGNEISTVALPAEFDLACTALQGTRALLAGRNSSGQDQLLVWDLLNNRKITSLWLLGAAHSLTASPYPSHRAYVGTEQGLEVIDVPLKETNLNRLLVERSLDLNVVAPAAQPLVLAAVPFRNGLPDHARLDNISFRRVLVGSGDLTSLLSELTAVVARIGEGGQTPSTQYNVKVEVIAEKADVNRYTVKLKATVTDEAGQPAPAGVAVQWQMAKDGAAEGGLVADPTFTDGTGVAVNTAIGLEPALDYTISAHVGARGDSVLFTGAPIQIPYRVSVTSSNLQRLAGGTFSADLSVKVESTLQGVSTKDLLVTFAVDPAGPTLQHTDRLTADGGVCANAISNMTPGATYTISATVEDSRGELPFNVPLIVPHAVTLEAQPYDFSGGQLRRPYKAYVRDQWNFLLPGVSVAFDQLQAPWQSATVVTDDQGVAANVAVGVQTGVRYTAKATVGSLVKSEEFTPRTFAMDRSATVLENGDYNLTVQAWVLDALGNQVPFDTKVSWYIQPAGAFVDAVTETDDSGMATAAATNLKAETAYTIYAVGAGGMGTLQHTQRKPAITAEVLDCAWLSDGLSRTVKIKVVDEENTPIVGAPVTWGISTGGLLQALDTVTSSTGEAMALVKRMTAGSSYTVTFNCQGKPGNVTVKSRAVPVTHTITPKTDGAYEANLTAYIADVDGNQLPAGQEVRWYLIGTTSSMFETSYSNSSSQAPGLCKGLAFDAAYEIVAVAKDCVGVATVRRQVNAVDLEVGALEMKSGKLARPLTATLKDNYGHALHRGFNISWSVDNGAALESGSPTTTDDNGKARNVATNLAAGTTYRFRATFSTSISDYEDRGSRSYTITQTQYLDQNDTTHRIRVTANPQNASGYPAANGTYVKWYVSPSGTVETTTTSVTSGSTYTDLKDLVHSTAYTVYAVAPDSVGQVTYKRELKYLAMWHVAGTIMIGGQPIPEDRVYAKVVDRNDRAVAGVAVAWTSRPSASGLSTSMNPTSSITGTDGTTSSVYSATMFADGYATAAVAGIPALEIFVNTGTSNTTPVYSYAPGTATWTAPDTSPKVIESTPILVEETEEEQLVIEEEFSGPQYKQDQLESRGMMEFARLSALPEATEVQASHQVSLRSAGAMREEGGRYALKVIATVKGAEGEPLVGMAVAWEGVPVEQIEVLTPETDQFGTAAALVHGLGPEEVYGITAVAGEVRDTLFADKSTIPDYYLVLAPLPVDESGAAGFTIDLRDGDQQPVKGATVRYTIRGGDDTTAGKLVTSRAREPKPLVVQGLKAGTAYEIEVTGKDVIAILRYTP